MKNAAESECLLQRYEHDEKSAKYFVDIGGTDDLLLPTTQTPSSSSAHQYHHKEPRKWPTFVAAFFLLMGWLLNEVALAWIHERVPRDVPPLPDLWFSVFPEVQGAIRITEYIMFILIVNALIIMFTHQHRWIVVRRGFMCIAFSYTFRALCVTVLQVPVPSTNTYCAPKLNSSLELVMSRVTKMFWSAGIEQLRPRELCGDLIVSGHTLTIFTSFLVFKTYAPKKLQPLSHLYQILAYCAVCAILMSRKHYFIDVILGYTVSTRVFMEYHSLAASYHETSLEANPLSWSWWSILIPFMERDAPANAHFHNHLSLSVSLKNVSNNKRSCD